MEKKSELCEKSNILMSLFEKDLNNGRLFHDRLFRRAYYSGIKISDIEDLIQDFYIGTSRSMKDFGGKVNESTDLSKDDRLGPYLGASFSNKIRSYRRNKNRINLTLFSEIENEDYRILQQTRYATKQRSSKEEAIKKEQIEKMMGAFQKLKEKDRMILSLFYFSGWKCRKIAKHLNIHIGTVCKELTTARKRLKKLSSFVN